MKNFKVRWGGGGRYSSPTRLLHWKQLICINIESNNREPKHIIIPLMLFLDYIILYPNVKNS